MIKKNETVLITGASEGIGLEFTKIFAENGYDLILISRNSEKLNNLKSEINLKFDSHITIFSKDLSNINVLSELNSCLSRDETQIDILINNAGSGVFGEFSQTDFKKELDMINVNITALTYLTKIVLRKMLKSKKGKILNVASTAAFKPGPMMAVYYATKSYVMSFSKAIAVETRDTGIDISVLCPGPTKTDFLAKASENKIHTVKFNKSAAAHDVALYGYNAIMKNKAVAIPGITNKLLVFISKFIPEKIISIIIYTVKKK